MRGVVLAWPRHHLVVRLADISVEVPAAAQLPQRVQDIVDRDSQPNLRVVPDNRAGDGAVVLRLRLVGVEGPAGLPLSEGQCCI